MPLLEAVSGVSLVAAAYLVINIALITQAWVGAGNKFEFGTWAKIVKDVLLR